MQVDEAIKKLKETAKQCRNSKECWENEDCCDCYVEVEDIFAIETVLNELEKKDKVIDEMAEYIDNITFVDEKGDYGCDFELLTKTFCKYNGNCKDCIKEYFYKRASEEDDAIGR